MSAVDAPTTAGLPHQSGTEVKSESKNNDALVFNVLNEFEQKQADEFQRRTGLDYKNTIAEIIGAADLHLGMKVLDVAASVGLLTRQLIGHIGEKGQITVVETTPEKVEKSKLAAQSLSLGRRLEWRIASSEKLPFNQNEFDLVLCTNSFPQMQPEPFLSETFRVLKPGGRLVIATELAPKTSLGRFQLGIRRSYQQLVLRNHEEARAQYHSSEEIRAQLNATGFRQSVIRLLQPHNKSATVFALIKAVK